MKKHGMKTLIFVVAIGCAMLMGFALQARNHGTPRVSSQPLYCYEQGGKTVCFDSNEPGEVSCSALDGGTVYCAAKQVE